MQTHENYEWHVACIVEISIKLFIMGLKSEFNNYNKGFLEIIDNNINKVNKNYDIFTNGLEVKKPSCDKIQLGLCTSCVNKGNCHWQENNKIYCEHYL